MGRLRARVKNNRPLRAALFLGQNVLQLARPVPAAGPGGAPRHQLAVMVRVKNEARFLPEWLAYHVSLGFDHCFLYDNNSSDDIESVMAPFTERGWLTYVPWPTIPASPSSHDDFLRRFGPSCRWVAFLDADEFIVEARPNVLHEVLEAAEGRPAVALNSRYFGSAFHVSIPDGLVIEQFDRAGREITDHVKVIARPAAIARYRNDHNFYYRLGRLARTTTGARVFGSFVRAPADPDVVVNHYVYRSREDYEVKARRGVATTAGGGDQTRYVARAESEFARHVDVQVPFDPAAVRATAHLLETLGYPRSLFASDATSASAPPRPAS